MLIKESYQTTLTNALTGEKTLVWVLWVTWPGSRGRSNAFHYLDAKTMLPV